MNPSDFNSLLLEKVFDNVQDAIRCSELSAYCQILAGIFALAYIGNIFWKTWGKGQEIHIVDFTKPFVVLICIMNFSLVTGLLDNLIYVPLNTGTNALVENNNNVLSELSNYIYKKSDVSQDDSFDIDHPIDSAKKMFDAVTKIPKMVTMTALNLLAQILCIVAKTCMIAYSYLLRIILTIFGPMAFALSLIPYFSDNIKNWIGKYIGALLYIPICNIILYTTQCFATAMFKINTIELVEYHVENAMSLKLDILSSELGVTIMFIVSACAYFTVPSIAGFILSMAQSTGNVAIGATVKSAATIAGMATAGVVTGGASLASSGDGGFLQSIGQIIQNSKGNSSNENNNNNDNSNSGAKGDG
ncbi:MAG: hypothetical protein MJZ19_05430 [Paludibacteraceae bacterium]|nr:hypothetical protein [Paludibacteraceae bacterium]